MDGNDTEESDEFDGLDDLASPAERLLARWRGRERREWREPRLDVPELIIAATLLGVTCVVIGFSVSPAFNGPPFATGALSLATQWAQPYIGVVLLVDGILLWLTAPDGDDPPARRERALAWWTIALAVVYLAAVMTNLIDLLVQSEFPSLYSAQATASAVLSDALAIVSGLTAFRVVRRLTRPV